MKLHEKLTKEYETADSILFSYHWIFTDNIKRMEKGIAQEEAMLGKIYPIYQAQTMDGESISIDDLKGKPTLINLWFTSCAPCIEEMPALNKMKTDHSDRFNFLAITFDSEAKVKKLLLKHEFNLNQIVGSRELTTKLGFKGFPVNIFLDKDGVVVAIEGNVPFDKDENGNIKVSDGNEFVEKLEQLL